MEKKQKNYIMAAFILLIIISFILIVSSAGLLFGRHKIDLTSYQRYTMSKESENIVKSFKKPVRVVVYMSENLGDEYPSLGIHSQYILRLLEKYKSYAPEMVRIEIKNPEPYSPREKEALDNNIRPFPDNSGNNNLYFGAVLSNSDGKSFTIPYFSVQRQNYAEQDITRILAKLGDFKEKTVGIASFGVPVNDNWLIVKQLGNDYNLENVPTDISQIPLSVDVLLVIHPQRVSRMFTYALDQYILRGGKLIMLMDPDAKFMSKLNLPGAFNKSGLLPFLENIGVKYNEDIVAGDKSLSQSERKNNTQERSSILNLNLGAEQINQQSPLTRGMFKISLRSSGIFELNKRPNTEYTELFSTSGDAGTVSAVISKFGDYNSARNVFHPDGKSYALGYLIEGWFDSLYEENLFEGTALTYDMLPFIIGSVEKSQIVLLADSDLIYNDAISNRGYEEKAGAYDIISSSNNGDFILRVVDYMAGNKDVVGINPRYLHDSDFTVAEQIYSREYQSYRPQYEKLENDIISEENALNKFTSDIKTGEANLSISAIKKIEGHNRNIQNMQKDLKHLDYLLGKSVQEQMNLLITLNVLIFPFVFIFLLRILVYIKQKRSKQKALGLVK